MYESFYGLKEKPFTLLPDPEYLYLSQKHQRALTHAIKRARTIALLPYVGSIDFS